jgi:DNA-nicking Smr family endonuclease
MNATEQRAHTNRVHELANAFVALTDSVESRLNSIDAGLNERLTVGLSSAQARIDAHNTLIVNNTRQIADLVRAITDETVASHRRADETRVEARANLHRFTQRGFWSRLNWLITGR